jgi:hypothetical protein
MLLCVLTTRDQQTKKKNIPYFISKLQLCVRIKFYAKIGICGEICKFYTWDFSWDFSINPFLWLIALGNPLQLRIRLG